MTFREKSLWVLVYVFVICGFGLILGGAAIMPEHLPANMLSSWLHLGALTCLAGFIGLFCAAGCLTMLHD